MTDINQEGLEAAQLAIAKCKAVGRTTLADHAYEAVTAYLDATEGGEDLDAVVADAESLGVAAMLNGQRIDPKDFYKPTPQATAPAPGEDVVEMIARTICEAEGLAPEGEFLGQTLRLWENYLPHAHAILSLFTNTEEG